ncbi:MAG: zinc-binding dehydrogenase [Sulfolobales archaeon]
MRAVVMSGVGDVSVLVEREVDTPKISSEEVLLRVRGCGVCYRDTLARRGLMRVKPPVIPGHEVVGEVVETGDKVSSFSKGDLVASLIYIHDHRDPRCGEGRENICRNKISIGEERDGCYAEYISLPHWVLEKIRDPGESPPEAYSFSACVIGTIVRALKTIGGASEGESVLVTGASGGVGIHAVQVAKAYGLRVIAVTRSSEKAEIIKRYRADHVIVYEKQFSEEVRKLTDGEGVDYVIETVGGPTLRESIRSLRWGGKVLLIGNIDPNPQQLMLGHLILRENSILGILNSCKRELREAIELLRKGLVKPVYRTIPLDVSEIRRAHEILESGGSIGRFVIKP